MTIHSINKLAELLVAKRLLIFDYDGTLADTSSLHAAAFNYVFSPWKISVDYSSIAGLSTNDAIAKTFQTSKIEISPDNLKKLVSEKQKLLRKLVQERLLPLPGVDRFLNWVRGRYSLAIYSSGSRGSVELGLERLGYIQFFDPLICAEDVRNSKPNPEGFLKILDITQALPQHAIIFEDSEAGIDAAVRANIDCVRVGGDAFLHFFCNGGLGGN